MMKKNFSVLFLGKQDDAPSLKALNVCQSNFISVDFRLGKFGQGYRLEDLSGWDGDYIISYLSPWIVPEFLLKRAKRGAINFHPASPEYPGIGCNNFALYEESREYGVTCHHMAPNVDAGNIILVKRFPVFDTDNVATLLSRTYDYLIVLFHEIIGYIVYDLNLPASKERWTRRSFTRKDLDELSIITQDMPLEEVSRRVRATSFENWKPTVKIHGFTFELKQG